MEQITSKRLNDQIVFMRKEVKRAIVHQIHHLTTTAKQLRNKKGSEEQKQKNVIKADNMIAEITILRKLNPDDVSVFGLTNVDEIEVKNFMSKQVIAPETKAMAKLCLRKNMRSVIDQFMKEIGSAHSRLMELLDKRQQHKEKKEKKKRKKLGKNEESNHAYDNTSDSILDSLNESIPDLIPAKSDTDHDSGNETLNLLGNNENDAVSKIIDMDNNLDIPRKGKRKTFQKEKNIPQSSHSERDGHSTQHVEKKNNELNSDNQGDKHSEISKIENKPLERKNIDPFFMTRDNNEYRTYCNIGANAKVEKEENEKSKLNDDNENFKNDFKKGNYNKKNHAKVDSFNRNKHNKGYDCRKTITHLGGSDRKSFDKKEFRKGEKRPLSGESPSIVKLHPSWEAKNKLSVSTAPFQGKKITFDD